MPDINWAGLGTDAIGNTIGAGMGLLLAGYNDRRQVRQQGRLLNQQYDIDNRMAEANYERQMRLWNDTGFGAQVGQMKAAGINPGLLYKGAGPGGTTQAMGGAVGGAKAPAGGMEIMNMMMNKVQMDLIKAQTDNVKADTANKPLQGANIQADTEVKRVTEENMNIANEIAGATQNAQKALVFQALRRSWEELEMVMEQNKWNEKQLEENFKQTTASIVEAYAKAKLADQQAKLPEAQIAQMAETIKQAWSQIDINATDVQIKQELANFTTGMGPQAASLVGDILNFISGIVSKKPGTTINHSNTRQIIIPKRKN